MRGYVLLVAAALGLLVPVVTLIVVGWGHVVFGSEILWIFPSSFFLLANDSAVHPWVLVTFAALVNVALYVLVAYLGGAIYVSIRRRWKK